MNLTSNKIKPASEVKQTSEARTVQDIPSFRPPLQSYENQRMESMTSQQDREEEDVQRMGQRDTVDDAVAGWVPTH